MKTQQRPVTTLEWAEAYADLGLAVLILPKHSKVPQKGSKGVYQATKDKAVLRKRLAKNPDVNLALACGLSKIAVIDKDRHASKLTNQLTNDGVKSYEKLASKHPTINGPMAISGNQNGGEHEFYLATLGIEFDHDPLPGVQVLSEDHHYVLVEPSVHPSGNPYKWAPDRSPFEVKLREMQEWQIDAFKKNSSGYSGYINGEDEEIEDEPTIRGYVAYLKRCPPAIEGQHGDQTTLMVALDGHDRGLSEFTTLELMREHYNERCIPGWTGGELEQKVSNAFKYAKRPQGWLNIRRVFADVEAEPIDTSSNQKATDWPKPEVLQDELLPVPPLAEELIPEGLSGWIKDTTFRMQVPLAFTATSAFVVAGSLIGTACGIKPKEKDDWLVVPNLWGGIVAKPGKLKSPALEAIIKPLAKLEAEAMGLYQLALAYYESKQQEYENRKSVLEKMAKEAIAREEAEKK